MLQYGIKCITQNSYDNQKGWVKTERGWETWCETPKKFYLDINEICREKMHNWTDYSNTRYVVEEVPDDLLELWQHCPTHDKSNFVKLQDGFFHCSQCKASDITLLSTAKIAELDKLYHELSTVYNNQMARFQESYPISSHTFSLTQTENLDLMRKMIEVMKKR